MTLPGSRIPAAAAHRCYRCGRRQNLEARQPPALAARSVPDLREEPVMTLPLPDRELREVPATDQAIRQEVRPIRAAREIHAALTAMSGKPASEWRGGTDGRGDRLERQS
jgi:hypothetical protein